MEKLSNTHTNKHRNNPYNTLMNNTREELFEEFVPFQESLELKEIGFNNPCFTYFLLDGSLSDTPKESGDDIKYQGDYKFDNHQNEYLDEYEACSAPTFSQAFRWFREKYGYFTSPTQSDNDVEIKYDWIIHKNLGNGKMFIYSIGYKNSYEEAELACLRKLIEIVKSNEYK